MGNWCTFTTESPLRILSDAPKFGEVCLHVPLSGNSGDGEVEWNRDIWEVHSLYRTTKSVKYITVLFSSMRVEAGRRTFDRSICFCPFPNYCYARHAAPQRPLGQRVFGQFVIAFVGVRISVCLEDY